MKKREAQNDPQFASFNLDPRVLAELAALGYEEPTPVQREAIPPLLAGRDLLGQAATGTGKTAAFTLPLLELLTPDAPARERTVALILVPTRELAMQVAEAVHRYGRGLGVQVLPIYGGASMETQLRALKRGVDVVVATPGRALDHIRRKTLRLESVRMLVLDEADEMLDMGFAEDLEAIISATPADRQTALFSATLPPRITAIAAAHLRDPVHVRIDREVVPAGDAPKVRQVVYMVSRAAKKATLGRILDIESPVATIVFCRTRTEVDDLTEMLNGRGMRAEALHGGLSQDQRERVMKRFRAHTTDLLIATDVAARGLDVPHVSHVINYDVPSAAEAYVHRIGRTGRARREGVAITLAEPRERGLLRNIERLTGQRIDIATVPTVADLRAHRIEQTRDELRVTILAGDLDAYRAVAESLTAEFDPLDIAAAALKQGGIRDGVASEEEIPSAPAPTPRPSRDAGRATPDAGRPSRDAGAKTRSTRRQKERAESRATSAAFDDPQSTVRVYIGAGRKAKVRPGDLVGAIANEAGIDAGVIGAVHITDRYSLVEVPEELADDVIAALQATKIKGKRVAVRRDRDEG
jgi:ATP-dependent RNA helicase DeaD